MNNGKPKTVWVVPNVDGFDSLPIPKDGQDAFLAKYPGATFRPATEEELVQDDESEDGFNRHES